MEGFIATLDDRIKALARAHDLITADRWGPARLVDLLETETGAYLGAKRSAMRFGRAQCADSARRPSPAWRWCSTN